MSCMFMFLGSMFVLEALSILSWQLVMHYLRQVTSIRDLSIHLVTLLIYVVMLFQESLQSVIRLQVVLLQTENLKGLLFGHEAALNSKPLLGDLLSALISEFLSLNLLPLLLNEFENSMMSLINWKRSYHLLKSWPRSNRIHLVILLITLFAKHTLIIVSFLAWNIGDSIIILFQAQYHSIVFRCYDVWCAGLWGFTDLLFLNLSWLVCYLWFRRWEWHIRRSGLTFQWLDPDVAAPFILFHWLPFLWLLSWLFLLFFSSLLLRLFVALLSLLWLRLRKHIIENILMHFKLLTHIIDCMLLFLQWLIIGSLVYRIL